jgi:V-type H+-transporting ATPase subunit a
MNPVTNTPFPNNPFVTYREHDRWVYAFGVDPVWKGATNELLFYNSLKMKMAVIIGVTQMTVGLFLKFLNGINFRQPLDIFFEFIPQVTFLLSIFGYLCFMIIYKWNQDYYAQDWFNAHNGITGANVTISTSGTQQAPLLLNELIFMFLGRKGDCPENCPLYPGQVGVQFVLFILAIASVPVMMFAKPVVMLIQHKMKSKDSYQRVPAVSSNGDSDSDQAQIQNKEAGGAHGHGHGHGHGEEFEFGEIMIHQSLETVEFVLGSVSHTASYLRLWALSLAHSELATVFWDKTFYQTFEIGASYNSALLTGGLAFVGVTFWIGSTIGIILFMETLSAFLHALRLHWVEFQSKFYKGDGHLFKPFAYKRILLGEQD